ncbi:hypothetical protein [Lentzea sp. NPDC060358]|uniref:hypothetical protein n=1 Tax=Lentzea sp. NPDC060358 TaxID=3347103 RepID=UPI0036554ABE
MRSSVTDRLDEEAARHGPRGGWCDALTGPVVATALQRIHRASQWTSRTRVVR